MLGFLYLQKRKYAAQRVTRERVMISLKIETATNQENYAFNEVIMLCCVKEIMSSNSAMHHLKLRQVSRFTVV